MSLPADELKSPEYMRPNQEWHSNDSLPSGAPTEDAVAVRHSSIRRKRRVFTIGFTAFSLGALLILFNSPLRNEFLAPGPLSSGHAQILRGQGSARCAACHEAGHQSMTGWIANLFHSPQPNHRGQSQKCMECHQATIANEVALQPHNQSPSVLAEKRSLFQLTSFSKNPDRLGEHVQEVACRTCHQEHHGNAGLSVLTDRQCQTCHTEVYHSFETDHPEFKSWPFARGSAIAFDHATHSGKHFPERGESFDCAACHIDDSFQNVKRLNRFEVSCARCHDQSIQVSSQAGLALMQLPILDLAAFSESKIDIGHWPEPARGEFDGNIPPLMRILLMSDEFAARALLSLGEDFEFQDLEPEDREQLESAAEIVWGMKRLLHELHVCGLDAMKARLERVTGKALDADTWRSISTGLDNRVFQEASAIWLPGLANEMAGQAEKRLSYPVAEFPRDILFGNMRQEDEKVWLAPNPLSTLKLRREKPQIRNLLPPVDATISKSEQERAPGKLDKRTDAEANALERRVPNPHSEVLTDNPLKRLLHRPDQPLPEINELSKTPATEKRRPTDQLAERAPTSTIARTVLVGAKSGWMRDDRLLQIRYHPLGHADPVLKGWLDLVASKPNADQAPATRPAFERLTSLNGPGLCRSCHTMERQADASFVARWQPVYRDLSIRGFTKFSHGPHLTLPRLQDCSACHQLDLTRSNAESFVDFDPVTALSNFAPMKRVDCASCHRRGLAGNGCTQCHNYHVGSRVVGLDK